MPLFITPMMKAPTTAPMIVPTPPLMDAPPIKTAAITSSQHSHICKGQECQTLGIDTGKFGSLFIAANGVDAPSNGRFAGNESIDADQERHDDQYIGQTSERGQQIGKIDNGEGDDRVFCKEERKGLIDDTDPLLMHARAGTQNDQDRSSQDAQRQREKIDPFRLEQIGNEAR